mmetsp:Transcript_6236/g.17580  ORF Transcript_6236/g.17580 Transcript_6236/m.17580 type:complete len:210 (-) Transcript_6236:28-657(-)
MPNENNHTKPELQVILTHALKSVLSGSPPPDPSDFPTESQLISMHQELGWQQLFFGRFVKSWRHLQEQHLHTVPHRKSHHKGTTWVTGITKILWTHVHNNWTLRNDARHGHDQETKEQKCIEQAQREIVAIYSTRTEVMPRDRACFYPSTDTHFTHETTSRQLRQWINTWQPLFLLSIKEARRTHTTQFPCYRFLPKATALPPTKHQHD